jgi:hypothetical protein
LHHLLGVSLPIGGRVRLYSAAKGLAAPTAASRPFGDDPSRAGATSAGTGKLGRARQGGRLADARDCAISHVAENGHPAWQSVIGLIL